MIFRCVRFIGKMKNMNSFFAEYAADSRPPPDELRWPEESAELKRFSEGQPNGCDSLPVETAVSAGIFV